MNPGELKERIEILKLDNVDNNFEWNSEITVWAKVEQLKTKNIFSNVGLGVKSIKFFIRKCDLTLHNAIKWRGKHCFLTDIVENDKRYLEITAALIEPKTCTVKRVGKPTLNELNRPVYDDPTIITFPGCLTEKYIRNIQDDPMPVIETQYVLVTPKVIELQEREIVMIDDVSYIVLISHTLDEYKNEYEIMARSEP